METDNRTRHNNYQISYYDTLEKPSMQPSLTPYIFRHIDRMIQHAGLERSHKILEVGAGLGRFSLPLLSQGYALTCLDLSKKMLDRLSAQANDLPLKIAVIDIADAENYFQEKFDRIIGFFTLHHLHDLEACFRNVSRIAAPGGLVAFCEPVAYNPLYYIQMAITKKMTWRGDGGIVRMRAGRVLPAMERAGFQETGCISYGFFPPFLTNTAAGKWWEDLLEKTGVFRWAHAFQLFIGRKPVS